MVDYGEFVPNALKNSGDSILRKLGEKMILIPWNRSNEDVAYEKMLHEHLIPGKSAALETTSYLK